MPNTEPYVQIACIAEQVLREANGVISAIRITDSFTLTPSPNAPADVKYMFSVTALIALKSGDLQGEYEIELQIQKPSGVRKTLGTRRVIFAGGISGQVHNVSLHIEGPTFDEPYWLDVLWGPEKKVLTRIPFQFTLAAPPTLPPETPESK